MKKKFRKKSKRKFLLIGILFLAFLFRFYNLQNWLFFGMDQEYEALIVKNIVSGKHFPLIGVNAADTGLYLGPAFIYFAAIPFTIFNGNPLGWAIIASSLGVFVCVKVYEIGKEMFSQKVGIFASFLYGGSFLTAFYERKFWNPMLVPLFSLSIGFFLYQLLKKRTKNIIWLALVFGLAIQTHLSILIFTPLIFFILWIRRNLLSKKIITLALLIFILLQAPLILFELRHNFLNTKAAVRLFVNKDKKTRSFSTFKERNALFLSTLGRFFWIPPVADLFLESGQCRELVDFRRNAYPESILLVFVGMAVFAYSCLKRNKEKKHSERECDFNHSVKIIIGIFLLTFLFVEFYNRSVFEYYLLFFFPWLAIALGRSLDFIWEKAYGKLIVRLALFFFIVLNLLTLFTSFSSYSYKDKIKAAAFAKSFVSDKNYSLEALGECSRFGGYRYLFEYFSGPPISSYMDSYFDWLYRENIKMKKPHYTVLLSMVDSRDEQKSITRWEEVKLRFLTENDIVAKKDFGRIKVFILTPS